AGRKMAVKRRDAMGISAGVPVFLFLALVLAGCGSTNLFSTSALDLFGTSSKATSGDTGGGTSDQSTDIDCPEIQIRSGAATLMVGSKPGESEPAALDLRYQASIIRT